jgi:hypothetical protein
MKKASHAAEYTLGWVTKPSPDGMNSLFLVRCATAAVSAGCFGLFFEEKTKNKNHECDRNDTKGDVSLPLHEIKSP